MSTPTLDETDRAIIYRLQENGRQPITDIADAVGVADNTVRNRIARLRDEGIIQGYSVDVDYDQAGVPHYYIFLCTAPVSDREELAAEVRERGNVVQVVTLMTGDSNVLIHAVGNEKDDITTLAYDIDDLGLRINSEHVVREHSRHPFAGFGADS